MKSKFVKKEIKYIGTQLAPHWIYKNFKIQGDAVVAFIGEVDVEIAHMVDIEDVIKNEPIYSPKMLSFIIEKFNSPIQEGVYLQRLFMCIIKEVLEATIKGIEIKRDGDDLFIYGKKLSVSICTKSLTSVLIHVGLNINCENTPIPTSGLNSDLKIKNIEKFANEVMEKLIEEIDSSQKATFKVRGII